jgi:prefoldin subunit 5
MNGVLAIPYSRWKASFESSSQLTTQMSIISHHRIVIEQLINRIKSFAACREKLRMKTSNEEVLLRVHHQLWVIADYRTLQHIFTNIGKIKQFSHY